MKPRQQPARRLRQVKNGYKPTALLACDSVFLRASNLSRDIPHANQPGMNHLGIDATQMKLFS